ncbi:hypothetical protein EI94DRAFT_1210579 [Lactarius quietus]|nr:hypothetical protein EI94DRAFT_1210579 [Lactarius quietus]
MAAIQDVEHRKSPSNPPEISSTQNLGTSTQIAESQGSTSQLRVQVTVLRAHNVPRIKNLFGLKLFVTVASQTIKKKTSSIATDGSTVQWNENLDDFIVQPASRFVLNLHAERFARRDILIGTHEMMPVESQTDVPFILVNGNRRAGQSNQPVTLYLTTSVSPNSNSNPIMPIDATNIQSTEMNETPPTEATFSTAEDSASTTRSTATDPGTHSPPTDRLPNILIPAGMSSAEDALQVADKAMATINLSDTWDGALERIKWVMETVSPVAELSPYAKMAYDLIFAIPKTLLEQFQRDDNIQTLLVAMRDAFDFTNQEDTFKAIERVPRQAQILTLMLQHVCNCCDFIQSYAKDSQFWKRMLKNIASQVDKKIEDFRTTLLELHKAFVDEATITTEITALQILDDVGIISANVGRVSGQLDGVATQLKWVSSKVSDVELDAKIREIPYGTGSRFTPEKGCLSGTRTVFLDFIVDWVNDPASERCLVLLGQAGTGKSSIAHEIARRFDKMHRLTSSFIFLRKEQSKREAYHLFTTLARDLSDRYPSFKAALGSIVKDNSSLRVGTRDYETLFQSLILEPLEDLHIVGPILVVIDALDESGSATGRTGLHTFLAKNLVRLPSNFRVLITSRPEDGIEPALIGSLHQSSEFMATNS